MTKILKCNCKHDYQDKTYGKGNRVYNQKRTTPGASNQYKCTVCLRIQTN